MYTSKSVGKMTLILGSQVRMDLGSFMPKETATGGNALKHYNILTVEMRRAGAANWPAGRENMPPNSSPICYTLIKAKMKNRYRGCSLHGYFYKGVIDDKFNTIALAKEVKLTDGKSYKDHKTFRGINDMLNNGSDELAAELRPLINDAYTRLIMEDASIIQEAAKVNELLGEIEE